MKSIGFFLLASAGFGLAEPVSGSNPPNSSVVITSEYVSQLIAEARTNNPSLRAADSKVRSATLNAESIRTWEDPNGLFGGSVYSSKGFCAMQKSVLFSKT